ncbi:hypothetical protein BUALT_Bualt14G0034700 [Buddleja alternifolia]|uniref:Uncharacterized protein n=1 Tax=Buddleja alternifolia TaxID=168488 RepID=A0AAV6WEI1_9LAMI|nr:hypothetical protein BUALT_Bualt14G0034700 [Buddleja alternifolia]
MAYAALASLLNITEQILNPDPYPVPFMNKQIESLQESVRSLLAFLESCSPNSSQTVKSLEIKIRDIAYKAEDALECQTAKHFSRDSTRDKYAKSRVKPQSLEKVIEEFDSIKQELKKIRDGGSLLEQRISPFAGSSKPASRGNNTAVEIDNDMKLQIMDRLAGQRSTLEVIPIVGMGGIGKTTLARTLFNDQSVIDRFYIRAWVTISQEYRVQDVVRSLLDEIKVNLNTEKDDGTNPSKEKLQDKKDNMDKLYKSLYGRRYLIVLDDVWITKAWDDLKMLFPNNGNTSRIMLTTRHRKVATYIERSYHELKLLNEDMSWHLFCRALFGQDYCPSELVQIGKKIAKNCRGLPLAIVVIAGLLSKHMTEEYWEHVADNLNPVLIKNDIECSEILSLSYNYLPHHLKPCFLYMGVFPEDYEIRVSKLIKLWIAEGFLVPVISKSLETVAEECVEDLISRNLILVRRQGSNGKPKTCSIHDLLREICLREASKEKFLYVLNRYINFDPEEANNQRRLSIHPSVIEDEDSSSDEDDSSSDDDTKKNDIEVLFEVMRSMSLTRSFISPASFPCESEFPFGSELLRVLEFEKESDKFPEEILELVNVRYLALDHLDGIPSSISRFWNLQTLIASDLAGEDLPSGIWDLTQLRHLQIGNCYLRANRKKCRVLKNLQTLSGVMNFKCKKKIIARIPNLKKLKTTYDSPIWEWSKYFLNNNLVHLSKLESLTCHFDVVPNETFLQNLSFPSSLKKLTLRGCRIPWEHMTIIGVLPNLEVLKLQSEAFQGPVWEPKEEEFLALKFLFIEKPVGLQEWRAENSHFPCLKHLILRECNVEEISSVIEEIASLEIVELYKCSPAINDSCKEIQDNGGIKVIVHPSKDRDDNNS